jgi:signal peptidase II
MEERLGKLRDYMVLLGGAGLIVAVDQWTKYLVRSRLELGEMWAPADWMLPYLRVVHWNNTGAAFGMFPAAGSVFTVVAVLVAGAILYYFPRVPAGQNWIRAALVMQFGGAIGNLIDRLTIGTVTDFISAGSFPVFNVADSCISMGVALLVATMWVEERRARQQSASESTPPEGPQEGGAESV